MNTTVLFNNKNPKVDVFQDMWSDELLAVWLPIAVYWIQCTNFEILMKLQIPFFEKYRIHTVEDKDKKNRVSFGKVLVMVALQHVVQIILGFALMKHADPQAEHTKYQLFISRFSSVLFHVLIKLGQSKESSTLLSHTIAVFVRNYIVPCLKLLFAAFIIDTHQYALHRLAHTSTFLYKYMHSHHHRLNAPYAFGALYNHPIEGFLLDTCGAAIAFELAGLTPRLGLILFTFSTLKTINDHCGYSFPWDPLTVLFNNNVNYHNIHHQTFGIKTNFSQPFFTFWDTFLNTEYNQVMKAKAEAKAAAKKQ